MEQIDNIQQYQVYVEAVKISGTTDLLFYKNNGTTSIAPEFDFWLPIFLTRSYEIFEYVQISQDKEIVSIDRQEINPFFIELSFFDTIKRHKILKGSDLTLDMIKFIKDSRAETAVFTNEEFINWFNNIGINELPWFKGTSSEITADDIDKISFINTHTISKASYYNIDINK